MFGQSLASFLFTAFLLNEAICWIFFSPNARLASVFSISHYQGKDFPKVSNYTFNGDMKRMM